MPNNKSKRAKLFLPFDALKGLQEALREQERVIVPKKSLSIDTKEHLSKTISLIKKGDIVEIVCYDNDEYVSIKGIVSFIDFDFKSITVVTNKIYFDDIIDIKLVKK